MLNQPHESLCGSFFKERAKKWAQWGRQKGEAWKEALDLHRRLDAEVRAAPGAVCAAQSAL